MTLKEAEVLALSTLKQVMEEKVRGRVRGVWEPPGAGALPVCWPGPTGKQITARALAATSQGPAASHPLVPRPSRPRR